MQGSADARRFVADFAGSDRYILDYLIEEVYQGQPTDMQDFLLKTSILERLTASLCDAVMSGGEGERAPAGAGQAMLEKLDRTNLFIVRLDEARQWYRYTGSSATCCKRSGRGWT